MRGAGEASAEERLRASLAERGFAVSVATSASMVPTIYPGDTLLLRPVSGIHRGMIVVYPRGPVLVIHRVVRVTGGAVVCRGDALLRCDPPVSPNEVIARATEVVGRGPLADGYLELARAFAHARLARLSNRVVRPWLEIVLLTLQLCGRTPVHGALSRGGFEIPAGDKSGVYIVGPAEATAGDMPLSLASAGPTVVVPAGIYSRFDSRGRRELLDRLGGRDAEVWAFRMPSVSRVLRVMCYVRGILRRRGIKAGESGDAWLSPFDGRGGGFVHFFTPHELRDELTSAGAREVTVETRSGGWLLKGKARF